MKGMIIAAAASLLLFVTAAQADPIADRQAAMKKNGAAMGVLSKIAKDEMAYDPAAVLAAFTTMQEDMKGCADLFPAGTETGDTKAGAKIFSDPEAFKAEVASFQTDIDAAIAAAPQDKAAFMPVFGKVAAHCGACHQAYRN
jgi:cytochrome c556